MGKSAFEKATSKMFSESGPAVRIATPGVGERLSKEQRERMREDAEKAEREQKEQERKEMVKTLVDMKVIPAADVGENMVKDEPKAVVEEKRQRGRPEKNPDVDKYVLMNFRVGDSFRQKLKVMAAEEGKSILSLFEEAFNLLFEKYGVK